MVRLAGFFTGLWLAVLAGVVAAETRPVVVELYTSQGCSSCPPADALLHKLAKRDDVIALALHVDYWDYIGWKDAFASPQNTARQKNFARVAGRRSVYTPQMIIAGQDHVVGSHPMDVADLIRLHAARDQDVDLQLSRSGETLAIRVESRGRVGKAVVQLVRYDPAAKVKITRGENAGKTLTYSNIVTEWRELGNWRRKWSGRDDGKSRGRSAGCGDCSEGRCTGPYWRRRVCADGAVSSVGESRTHCSGFFRMRCSRRRVSSSVILSGSLCDTGASNSTSKLIPSGWRVPKNGTSNAPVFSAISGSGCQGGRRFSQKRNRGAFAVVDVEQQDPHAALPDMPQKTHGSAPALFENRPGQGMHVPRIMGVEIPVGHWPVQTANMISARHQRRARCLVIAEMPGDKQHRPAFCPGLFNGRKTIAANRCGGHPAQQPGDIVVFDHRAPGVVCCGVSDPLPFLVRHVRPDIFKVGQGPLPVAGKTSNDPAYEPAHQKDAQPQWQGKRQCDQSAQHAVRRPLGPAAGVGVCVAFGVSLAHAPCRPGSFGDRHKSPPPQSQAWQKDLEGPAVATVGTPCKGLFRWRSSPETVAGSVFLLVPGVQDQIARGLQRADGPHNLRHCLFSVLLFDRADFFHLFLQRLGHAF